METTTDEPGARARPTIVVERRWAVSAAVAAVALLAALIVAVSVAIGGGHDGRESFPPGSGATGMTPPGGSPMQSEGEIPQLPGGGELPEGVVPPAPPSAGSMQAPESGDGAAPGAGAAPETEQGSGEPLTPDSLRQPGGGSGQDAPAG